MFINKAANGTRNLCGPVVAAMRKELGWSQRELAERLQREGLDVDKNAIQRIEAGQRFVTDVELVFLSRVLRVKTEKLLGTEDLP